jgi:ribonuclease HI
MHGGCRLPLLLGPDSWWNHQLREGLRRHLWSEAASRRGDMDGLQAEQGLDRKATMAVLDHKKLPAEDVGMLRSVLSGSIRLQKRLHEAKISVSPVCSFCGMCEETVRHCYWECPRWAHIRGMFDLPSPDVSSMWPACTIDCGIFVEDVRVIALGINLQAEEEMAKDICSYFSCAECRAQVAAAQDVSELQVIWTDGASSNNQDHRFRRSGSGVYYAADHAMNMSAMCPGLLQSNQRAELLAVVLACLRDPRPLDIRSDSEYVCNGFKSIGGWAVVGWQGDHADLWNLLCREIASRAASVQVSWVKGHATKLDIDRGRSTEEDKEGNDGADGLAVAGAQLHAIPSEVLDAAKQRMHWAMNVQQMMVTVLRARFLAEGTSADDAGNADRGSECDDCMDDGSADAALDCECIELAYDTEENGRGVDHGDCMIAMHCMNPASDNEPVPDNEELHPLACLYK